jgi:hypothetical protein
MREIYYRIRNEDVCLLLIGKRSGRSGVHLFDFSLSLNSPTDFNKYLHMQCEISHIIYPKWVYQWTNIKVTFTRFYSIESGRKLTSFLILF